MGIHVIKVPDIGEGIAEVELVEWHVKPGDMIREDQNVADVMTDKANVEIPTPVAGKVIALGGKPGDVMAVGSELIRIETEGAGNVEGAVVPAVAREASSPDDNSLAGEPVVPAVAREASKPDDNSPAGAGAQRLSSSAKPHIPASAVSAKTKPPVDQQPPPSEPPDATSAAADKARASPAVRRHARELDIDLDQVDATGAGGRITHEDVERRAARGGTRADARSAAGTTIARVAQTSTESTAGDSDESVPVIGLRRKIAQKMQEAKRRIPHFTYVEEVDVSELEALRATLNAKWGATRGKLTLLPFLMRAIVRAIPDFPQVNARFKDDDEGGGGTLTRYRAVHLGIATQTDGGLMVPVVRNVESRDLWSCAAEVARLAEAARTGKASRDELTGSTITITSLGTLGGIVTTPVINYPEVAIVGVNRIVERPVIRNGAIVPRMIMNLSSSFDHRVVDGMDGARFVQALRGYLEAPATLFIE